LRFYKIKIKREQGKEEREKRPKILVPPFTRVYKTDPSKIALFSKSCIDLLNNSDLAPLFMQLLPRRGGEVFE
jgi:hypothetical protein